MRGKHRNSFEPKPCENFRLLEETLPGLRHILQTGAGSGCVYGGFLLEDRALLDGRGRKGVVCGDDVRQHLRLHDVFRTTDRLD